MGLGMQIPELLPKRKFVSAGCHADFNAHKPPKPVTPTIFMLKKKNNFVKNLFPFSIKNIYLLRVFCTWTHRIYHYIRIYSQHWMAGRPARSNHVGR